MSRAVFVNLLLLLIIAGSCKSNEPMDDVYELEGKWEIYEAYRNNQLTNTLEDGYFLFSDSTMETNILGSPIYGAFSLLNSAFTHDSTLPATYQIVEYSKDTMEVDTEIRNYKFKFKLHKQLDSIPANQ
jgi:hypothetical protein